MIHASLLRTARTSALALLGAFALHGAAGAQTGLIQHAGILAYEGGPVPDANGTPLPGLTFGGTASEFSNSVVSESGRVVFRGRTSPPTPGQEYGIFSGTSAADLRLVLREGDPVPGVAGATVLTLNPNVILSPIGTLLIPATITGAGVTTTNDTVWLGGTPGALALWAREGDPAPGTAGAALGQLSGSPLNVCINRNGHFYFKNTLVGGDVVGTTNDEAWFAGPAGALQLVLREGSVWFGAPASILGTALSQMNDAGEFLVQVSLSTTTGAPPATAANDALSLLYTPGMGTAPLVHEGDVAPGTAGGVYFGLQGVSSNCFTTSGRMAFTCAIVGGDVIGTTNDSAIFVRSGGAFALAAREGQPAPGTAGAEFASFLGSSIRIHDDGTLAFAPTLRGGDVVAGGNDSAFYAGQPGALQLVVRRGQVAPGTNGSTFGPFNLGPYYRIDDGRFVFANTIVSAGMGSPGGRSWWFYDPSVPILEPIWLPGETLTVGAASEVIDDLLTFSALNNTDSASLPYSHAGELTGQLSLVGGNKAIFKLLTVLIPGEAFCAGDGSGTACPCGNASAVGADAGCLNSFGQAARLSATGNASLSLDTVVLSGTQMPNAPALYFQGTAQVNAGAGSTFGDGLRCAGGTVVRLKQIINSGGGSQYPQAGDPPVSVRGLVMAPGIRTYQIWYRNNAAFCTPDGWNLSNGLEIDWQM